MGVEGGEGTVLDKIECLVELKHFINGEGIDSGERTACESASIDNAEGTDEQGILLSLILLFSCLYFGSLLHEYL